MLQPQMDLIQKVAASSKYGAFSCNTLPEHNVAPITASGFQILASALSMIAAQQLAVLVGHYTAQGHALGQHSLRDASLSVAKLCTECEDLLHRLIRTSHAEINAAKCSLRWQESA